MMCELIARADCNLLLLMHASYHQCSIYTLQPRKKIFTNNMVITILDYIARHLEIASRFCRGDVMTRSIYDAQGPILPVPSQKRLDGGESLFDRIIIGRIWRQKDELAFWKAQVSIRPSV